ncbi:MAG TPA: hypothetical protein DCZ94_07885 [Lentisphaeria bacterium]|nr:MAG: hypothetical protein A2X48_24285 [Lentisphaerae bacterium GWF2_49_21]HBC86857.1 hypothetical protein [Lentisphaeria bacterium]
MVLQAIEKEGGLFIPLKDKKILKRKRFSLTIEISRRSSASKKGIVERTAGLLKGKMPDGLEYQNRLRSEWGR